MTTQSFLNKLMAGETTAPVNLTNVDELAQAIANKMSSGGSGVALTNKEKFYQLIDQSNKIVWIGDSITENPVGYISEIEALFSGKGKTFINEAVGGYTTKDLLDNIVSYTAHNPDLYIVAIGVNDIRYNDNTKGAITKTNYLANITNILTPLKNTGAEVVCISVWPTFWKDANSQLSYKDTNDKIVDYNNGLAKYSHDLGCYFIDAHTPIVNYANAYNFTSIASDGIHPSGNGIKLYAKACLIDHVEKGVLTSELSPSGKHFFKLEILDHETFGAGGYCGIKNISANALDVIGLTANTGYTTTNLFGSYNASAQFYNKAYNFPFVLTFSCATLPDEAAITGIVSGTGYNRGPKSYVAYYSTNPQAMSDLEHPSWEVYNRELSNKALAVNVLPRTRKGVYYMFIANGTGQLKMKRFGTSMPVRVWTQNIVATSAQRYPLIFGSGASAESDALVGNLPSYVVTWESETEVDSIILESFNNTLQSWTIKKSYSDKGLDNPVHTSWKTITTGTGDGTATL